uniref:RNA methyltransferase n=1 Tax=Anopheles funestus TaxID=62324 RepID=A0A182RSV7_ANOFN
MEGLSVASAEDDSAADGSGGGGGGGNTSSGGGGGPPGRGEETRRCNAPRAARPPASMYETGGGTGTGGRGGGNCGGHNRKINQQQQRHQQQQQQQQLQQHGGGKKQKKQQKWKANKYRGRGGGPERKDCPARGGRKDKSTGGIGTQIPGAGKPEDGTAANGLGGDDQLTVGKGTTSGEVQAQQTEPGCFHQVNQQQVHLQHGTSSSLGNAQQQTSGTLAAAINVGGQQQGGAGGGSAPSSANPPQKQKHPKQQNLTPMEVRNKRLQSVSKFFLPDKRPRKECIVPPTKFLLGGNISDPLNLNSLQNESENAVTPKSSPIPTPPHYKAKIEVIIPPNINDPLHLLDPVDSVEYEMQLCSPMKRKQRTRNKRKRKSRTATERNADGLLSIDQLPPPPGAEEHVGSSGVTVAAANKAEEATTAEEASFTGIGQKFADAAGGERFSLAPDMDTGSHFQHLHFAGQSSSGGGSAITQQQGHISAVGVGTSVGTTAERNVSSAGTLTEQDRDREKAMRNLKLDLESAGGRKRRTSESTNSTKNKLRRMDSMDKIVSPVIPQPGGWKRAHWPTNAGGSGAAGNAGRNRTRTYSTTSNTDELHGEEATTSTDRGQVQDSQVQEKAHHSERNDAPDDVTKKVFETGMSTAQEGVLTGREKSVTVQHKPVGDVGSVDRPLALGQGTTEGVVPQPHTALAASSRYHFGNYDRYYGYHSLNEFIDVRLKVFLRNSYLFRDKDVLDIGCNVGLMTIAVAKMLQPKSATGIDVDGKLVAKARKNLSKYVRVPRTTGHAAGRRVNRESVTAVSIVPDTMEASEEPTESRNTIPLECDPLQLGVSELATSVTTATTSQTGEESIAPAAATPSNVAETTVAEVAAVNEPPGENVLQPPVALVPKVKEENEEEGKDIKPPELVDQPSQVKSEPMVTVPGPDHSSKCLLRQKRRRKRMAQKRRPGQHHQQHHQQHQQLRRQKTEQSQYFPISFPLTMGNLSGKEYQMDIGRTENKFPHNVRFKTMNYVLKDESLINYDTQQYDLILCLSVTKWIHLNYGDMGLKIAFKRMFNHLRPGGKLILEAQNWASYKKKKKLTATIFENYKSIDFLPSRFHDYLLSPEVGFSHSFPLGIPRHLSKGFRRPILLYIKGDFTPSQAKWSDTYHPGTPYENHRGIYTDIVTASQSAAGCIWGAMTPYAPSYSYRQPPTPSHGGGSGSGSGGFASTSPYYNPRQTDSYLPSYDNIGNGHRPGSYCFASPLYSTTWSPPSDMLATSGGGGGSYRRSASNTPNSASIRSADNDEHYYAGTVGGGSQRRHHVYPPIDVLPPLLGYDGMRPGSYRSGGGGGGGGGAMTDSDSEPSSNSASQTPTRQQQLAGSFLTDDQSNSPSGHSQPDK